MDENRTRAATAADVPAIAEIVEQAYRHYIARIGKPPGPMPRRLRDARFGGRGVGAR
jgi:hypothetical protein